MKSNTTHCSLSYHQLVGAVLETFAHGVSTGIYTHNPPFTSPPLSQTAFDAFVTDYHDKYEAYKNGGKSQKGDFLTAKSNLITAMDSTAAYVDALPTVDESMIVTAGFTPTKTGESKAVVPAVPTGIVISRGTTGELLADCTNVPGATYYGCIMILGNKLPPNITINGAGQLVATNSKEEAGGNSTPPADPPANAIVAVLDLNKGRKKQFIGLIKGIDYYFYYYAGNTAGVSQLSEAVSLMCA